MQVVKEYQVKKMLEKNMQQAQIDMALQQMDSTLGIILQYISQFVGGIIFFMIIALIIAAIFKKEKPEEIKQI